MSHTYFLLLYHLVWSTKNREPIIQAHFEECLHHYIGGTFKAKDCFPIQIGGMPDHLHVLVAIPPSLAIAEVIRNVKVSATKWIHSNYSDCQNFGWQEGYGAFSVSSSNRQAVKNYIINQQVHHKRRDFKEEFLELLDRHGVEYDEKYLWK